MPICTRELQTPREVFWRCWQTQQGCSAHLLPTCPLVQGKPDGFHWPILGEELRNVVLLSLPQNQRVDETDNGPGAINSPTRAYYAHLSQVISRLVPAYNHLHRTAQIVEENAHRRRPTVWHQPPLGSLSSTARNA